jgi:hypothetical protein
MLDTYGRVKGKVENFGPMLDQLTTVKGLWNTSKFDFAKLLDDPDSIRGNLLDYIAGFSPEAREVLDRFDFDTQIARLHKSGLLYLVLGKFAEIDLHPDRVSNLEMGYLYEELIRRFSELSNETAGEHFTPRGNFAVSTRERAVDFRNWTCSAASGSREYRSRNSVRSAIESASSVLLCSLWNGPRPSPPNVRLR